MLINTIKETIKIGEIIPFWKLTNILYSSNAYDVTLLYEHTFYKGEEALKLLLASTRDRDSDDSVFIRIEDFMCNENGAAFIYYGSRIGSKIIRKTSYDCKIILNPKKSN